MPVSRKFQLCASVGLIFLVSALPSACAFGSTNAPSHEFHTEHYDLNIEGANEQELQAVVESLFVELSQFFHGAPKQRLRVQVLATRENFMDAVRADMFAVVNIDRLDGIYSPISRISYVRAEPTDIDLTRMNLIHECTHQFHFLTRLNAQQSPSCYYTEGIACYFGMHRKVGNRIEFGVLSDPERFDRTNQALKSFERLHSNSFYALVTDPSQKPDFMEALALVSFLIREHRDLFDGWSSALDAGANPQEAWSKTNAPSDARLSEEFVAWVRKHQGVWARGVGSWRASGVNCFEGTAPQQSWAILLPTAPHSSLKFSAESADASTLLGVMVGYAAPEDHLIIEVTADGLVWVCHRDRWSPDKTLRRAHIANPRKFSVAANNSGDLVTVAIDGAEVIRLKVPKESRMGLAVYNGTATFRSVESK